MLAVDSETTGLFYRHGCKPFIVSTCTDADTDEPIRTWRWRVDWKSRDPNISPKDIREISDYINSDPEGVVFFNSKFDLHMLRSIGVKLPPWKKIHDAQIMSHCFDSSERYGGNLKDLAARYLAIPTDDSEEVRSLALKARGIAKKIGWTIANPDHPHFRPANGDDKLCDHHCDMWLPYEIAAWDEKPKSNYGTQKAKPLLTPEERKLWKSAAVTYANLDVERTIGLWIMFKDALETEGLWDQYTFRMKALASFFRAECCGTALRKGHTVQEYKHTSNATKEHMGVALRIGNKHLNRKAFNPNSSQQISKLLFEKWKLPVLRKTATGLPGADGKTLLKLAFGKDEHDKPFIKPKSDAESFMANLTSAKKFGKAAETLGKYVAHELNSRLYSDYTLPGTKTTRVSCRNPNGQQVSKGDLSAFMDEDGDALYDDWFDDLLASDMSLRGCFGPPDGRLWYSIDCSQLQLRIFAYISEEKDLIKAFLDGWDAHDYMASRIFKLPSGVKPNKFQRRIAKNVNFGFIFGASPEKIEKTAGISGLWDDVTGMFPNAHTFMEKTKNHVRKHGYVHTPGGYRLTCHKPHAGVNYMVQGSEGEIIQQAMINCDAYLSRLNKGMPESQHSFITLQVHDELVFDCPRPSNLEDDGTIRVSSQGKEPVYMEPSTATLPYVGEFSRIMEAAGKHYGMVTPVDAELILHRWDYGIKLAH